MLLKDPGDNLFSVYWQIFIRNVVGFLREIGEMRPHYHNSLPYLTVGSIELNNPLFSRSRGE